MLKGLWGIYATGDLKKKFVRFGGHLIRSKKEPPSCVLKISLKNNRFLYKK